MADLVVKAGKIIDGKGGKAIEHGFLRIEGGRIKQIGTWDDLASVTGEPEVLDACNTTVMPGLVNAHTHLVTNRLKAYGQVWLWPETLQILRAAHKAQSEMAIGVTSVRDLGAKGTLNIVLKRAIGMGLIPGPRMVVCGQLLCMTGGHGYYMGREVDGPESVRLAVRQMFKLGADFIKVIASGGMGVAGAHPVFPWDVHVVAETVEQELTEPEIRVAAEEAHKIGRRVSAHAYGMPAIGAALAAGVDSIEHGILLDDQAADYMAENNVSLVPTLTGIQQIVDFGPERGVPQFIIERAAGYVDAHKETVARARSAGVRMAAGTDSSGELRMELEQLVDAGLTNGEAIVAATRSGAEVLELERDVGTLEAGKLADILAVEGNPLERITDVRNVRLVLFGGDIFLNRLDSTSPPGSG
jgi:imidazolonepropionase-like amidohydrolase